jgi:hypothetical protein
MKLTKEQKTILWLLALAIIGYVLYKRSKTTKSEESGLADINEWKNIGKDIYTPPTNEKRLAKKYIDGTIQEGFLINDKNEYRGGETDPVLAGKIALKTAKEGQLSTLANNVDMNNLDSIKSQIDGMGNQTNCSQGDRNKGYRSWKASNGQIWCDSQSTNTYNTAATQINSWKGNQNTLSIEIGTLKGEIEAFAGKEKAYIPVPSDKGFIAGDGKGNYFYFEELPEFKRNEIKKLEDLKAAAEKAERDAKAADDRRKAKEKALAEQKRKQFEMAKIEAERKAAEERMLIEKQNQEITKKNQEKKKKENTTIIILVSVLLVIGIVGFIIWKKYKK